jgi:UDP-N-acetyl-D-mannosaminuronate dehydrogenase
VKGDILAEIENKTANVVVLGLGYVGLPVACLFAEAGFPVVGIRRSQDKVELVNRGICPIEGKEPGVPGGGHPAQPGQGGAGQPGHLSY